jgi:hypothetical protein
MRPMMMTDDDIVDLNERRQRRQRRLQKNNELFERYWRGDFDEFMALNNALMTDLLDLMAKHKHQGCSPQMLIEAVGFATSRIGLHNKIDGLTLLKKLAVEIYLYAYEEYEGEEDEDVEWFVKGIPPDWLEGI